jgi:hypothetical protein
MVRDLAVSRFFDIVRHDEQQIETRKQRVWQCDVLVRVLMDIVLRVSLAPVL